MLPKVATLCDANFSVEKRRAKRRSIRLGFETAERRDRIRVLILDLSRTGMRIQTSARFEVGEKLELLLPEAGSVSVTIVRANLDAFGNGFGCEFDEPVSEGAVSAAILAAPPFAPPITKEERDQWIRAAKARYPEVQPIPDLLLAVMFLLVALLGAGFIFAIGFLPVSAG